MPDTKQADLRNALRRGAHSARGSGSTYLGGYRLGVETLAKALEAAGHISRDTRKAAVDAALSVKWR